MMTMNVGALTALHCFRLGVTEPADYYPQIWRTYLDEYVMMRSAAGMILMVLTGVLTAQAVFAVCPERPIRMIVPSASGG